MQIYGVAFMYHSMMISIELNRLEFPFLKSILFYQFAIK
jgi:hypothetical protein